MQKPSILGLVSYKVFPPLMGGQKCIVDFYKHLSEHADITLALSKENLDIKEVPFATEVFLYNHWRGISNLWYLFRLIKLIKKANRYPHHRTFLFWMVGSVASVFHQKKIDFSFAQCRSVQVSGYEKTLVENLFLL